MRAAGRWRSIRTLDGRLPVVTVDGVEVVTFAGNDYLGLAGHPAVAAAASLRSSGGGRAPGPRDWSRSARLRRRRRGHFVAFGAGPATASLRASVLASSIARAARVVPLERDDLVDLSPDLRDRSADCVRDREVLRPLRALLAPGSVGRGAGSKPPPTTTTGSVPRSRLHPVDRLGDSLLDPRDWVPCSPLSIPATRFRVTDPPTSPAATARSRRSQHVAAEDQCAGGQLVADAVRPDLRRRATYGEKAAADPERQHVRHPKVRTNPADLDRDRCLARKAVLEDADVRGRAPDVDHCAVGQGPERNAAPRIEFVGPDAKVATG